MQTELDRKPKRVGNLSNPETEKAQILLLKIQSSLSYNGKDNS